MANVTCSSIHVKQLSLFWVASQIVIKCTIRTQEEEEEESSNQNKELKDTKLLNEVEGNCSAVWCVDSFFKSIFSLPMTLIGLERVICFSCYGE